MKKIMLIVVSFLMMTTLLSAQIDSQWRGPDRDGIYPNEKLLKKWPTAGPKLIWETELVGKGFSSPAPTTDRVYVSGMKDGNDYLFAFNHKGKLLWKTLFGSGWTTSYPGSRTTPTVVGDKIYLLSGKGKIVCLNTKGKIIWSKKMETFQGNVPEWGKTESLLVQGNRVFFTAGSKDVLLAALNRNTGAVIWKIKGDGNPSSYAGPRLINHNGRSLLLTMTAKSLVGFDATTGKFLWSKPHITSYDVNPNTPLYKDGYIYTVSGYGTGGQMFKLSDDGNSIEKVWEQKILDSQMGGVVLVDGYIYGSGHKKRAWYCVDWKTGEVKFSEKVLGNKGNIIYADGLMYCYSEKGDMGLVKPDPAKFDVISSFKITRGSAQHWAHPVIKDGRLYVRHGNALMVFNIAR